MSACACINVLVCAAYILSPGAAPQSIFSDEDDEQSSSRTVRYSQAG